MKSGRSIVPTTRLVGVYAIVLGASIVLSASDLGSISASILALFAGIVIFDGATSKRRVKTLEVRLPELVRVSAGAEAEIAVIFDRGDGDSSRELTFRTGMNLPESFALETPEIITVALGAGESAGRVSWKFRANERGLHYVRTLHIGIESTLAFWEARSKKDLRCEIRVYPNVRKNRSELAAIFLNRGNPGLHLARAIGKGREFEKLREYQPGDAFEDIHWRTTAKRGFPVTRVYQVERTQDIYVIIDVSRLAARPIPTGAGRAEPLIETYLRTALLVGLAARTQGDRFGVAAYAGGVRTFLKAGGGAHRFSVCRDALYRLEPERTSPDYAELITFIATRIRRRALIMLFADLDEQILSEEFRKHAPLIAKRHLILAHSARPENIRPAFTNDAHSMDDLYDDLSGQLLWRRRKELRGRLKAQGIAYSDAPHERFAVEAVRRYLEVKRRQIL